MRRDEAVRLAMVAVFLSAVAVATTGCGSSSSKAPAAVVRLKSELKRPYISMRAADAPAGSEFDRVPIDLWGPFRWEATFGAFDASRTAGLENTFFGTELDSRGAPEERYYGIYARLQDGGVFVFAEYEEADGVYHALNGITYPGVLAIDAAIEHDGTNLRFFVKPRGSEAGYDDIGTVPHTPQTFPLNPGIGSFDFTGDAEVGFDRMRVVSNSPAPTPVDAAHAAFNSIFDAIDPLAQARYALTAAVPDTAEAAAQLAAAAPKIAAADAAVAAVAPSVAPKKLSKKARKALRAAKKRLAKMQKRLTKDGSSAIPRVLNELASTYFTMIQSADAIVPQALRDSLPGDHHSLK